MASNVSAVATANPYDVRFTGQHTIVQWAHDVLTALGLPASTTNVAIMVTWANIESSGYNPNYSGGRNNPLNTTQPGHGGVGGGQQGNIMDYPSYADGVAAIVENLKNPNFGYPMILAGLRAQSPSQTFAAINASSFGTHIPTGTTPTISGVPGVNPFPDTAATGGGASGAVLTAATDPTGAGSLVEQGLENIPILGGLVKAGKETQALAKFVLNIFANWRYVAEVLAGMALLTIGGLLMFADVAKSKGPEVAGDVAKVAAVAA